MSQLKRSKHLFIPLKDIEIGTNSFEDCIGRGGYGRVYKGDLFISGRQTTVAVKRLNEDMGQGLKEFLNEIQLLSGQTHPNLISLLGYCDDRKERIIVYEYAGRGSLDRYLRRRNSTHTLTWPERLKICLDAARGLEFLHHHFGKHQSIIHRDIKSANILIDHNWVAKISDLGLSKLSLAGLDRSYVISHACGTPGYCEPEYIISGIVKKESDVYSFGMVLFEVLCGRLCTIVDRDGFLLSAKVVKDYYRKSKLDEIVDPRLWSQMTSDSFMKFSEIAHGCLLDDREQRPPMNRVVKMLEDLMKTFQVVRFRSLVYPKEDEFSLVLDKVHDYDDVVERLARYLNLDDSSKIRLSSLKGYFHQPKPEPIKFRGVKHLSDMLARNNQTLYYEVLDIPLPELEGKELKTLKVVFHHHNKDEVVIHTIRLPDRSTVQDLIDYLKRKKQVELSNKDAELRLIVIFNNKVLKVLHVDEKIKDIDDQNWTVHAEEVLEEEKDLGPRDYQIHVDHFNKNTAHKQNIRIGPVHLTLKEVKRATQKFSPLLKLGEADIGAVYKAQLPDGQVVAIKRAKKEHFDSLQDEFRREVELVAKFEHRNLVNLLGYVDEGNERLIVTEYVPNGTLREHLNGGRGSFLDFSQRLEICIDIAHGLTYLHSYAVKQIIHRDVKSSNILLTERMRAKLTDFGFARLIEAETDMTHVVTKVRGTVGYIDPEYLRSYELTPKSDVYSYGVLLIEILTGRRPVELKRSPDERVTVRWAFVKYNKDEIMDLVDPNMKEAVDIESFMKMLSLAFQCTASTRADRPEMKVVGEQLWAIRMDYLRNGGKGITPCDHINAAPTSISIYDDCSTESSCNECN